MASDVLVQCYVEASPKAMNHWMRDTGKHISRGNGLKTQGSHTYRTKGSRVAHYCAPPDLAQPYITLNLIHIIARPFFNPPQGRPGFSLFFTPSKCALLVLSRRTLKAPKKKIIAIYETYGYPDFFFVKTGGRYFSDVDLIQSKYHVHGCNTIIHFYLIFNLALSIYIFIYIIAVIYIIIGNT